MMRVLCCLAALACASCSVEEQIMLADGSSTKLSDWDDRHLAINYWAEWCAPCRHEIPELNELHRADRGIVVLGVNYDGVQGEKLTDLMARMGIEFPVLAADPQERYGYERAETLPMTVIINPAREVQDVLIGPQTAASIEAAVLAN